MANEPEPKNGNSGSTPSFSIEDELNRFKTQLDGKTKVTLVAPGFLFRDGRDLSEEFSLAELRRMGNWGWGGIDNNLLEQHKETYRRALETRRQLLDSIKPIEILGMVRDVWGEGEIKQKAEGVTLTYSYLIPTAQREGGGSWIPRRSVGSLGNSTTGGYISSGMLTGRWYSSRVQMTAEVGVGFGNIKFPTPGSTYTPELDEFFADHSHPGAYHPITPFPYVPIPREIWRRSDNLVILTSIPSPKPTGQGSYTINSVEETYFNQSASQQGIMDVLAQKLEAQRIDGLLPSQFGAVENAKIEELRKRGLFIEPGR